MSDAIGMRSKQASDHGPTRKGWPLKDVLIRHRLLALDRRYAFALPNITVGRVTDAIRCSERNGFGRW